MRWSTTWVWSCWYPAVTSCTNVYKQAGGKMHLCLRCCYHHLHSLHIQSMWGTELRSDYSIIFHFITPPQKRLNSRHFHHRVASLRAATIGSDTEGQQTQSPVRFLAPIPAANSNWIFDWQCSDKQFVIWPGPTSLDVEPAWASAFPRLQLRLLPLLRPTPSCRTRVWMGAVWLSPADKSWLVLLLVGGEKMCTLNYLRLHWLYSLTFEVGSVSL